MLQLKAVAANRNRAGIRWHISKRALICLPTGVALILSSKNSLKAEGVLDDYRCRDIAEKVFDTVKNGIGLHRLRTSSSNQANGRLFLAFIAVILRALIESKLKKSNLLSTYSVDESLAILKKIKQIKLLDGTVVNLETPKKARIIQEAIESKVPKVEAPT
jgi:transposase